MVANWFRCMLSVCQRLVAPWILRKPPSGVGVKRGVFTSSSCWVGAEVVSSCVLWLKASVRRSWGIVSRLGVSFSPSGFWGVVGVGVSHFVFSFWLATDIVSWGKGDWGGIGGVGMFGAGGVVVSS